MNIFNFNNKEFHDYPEVKNQLTTIVWTFAEGENFWIDPKGNFTSDLSFVIFYENDKIIFLLKYIKNGAEQTFARDPATLNQ